MAENYNANSIQVLSDIEHMKLRRGMYIGEGHNPSQLLSEIFDNAIDEVQANASDRAVVTIDHKLNRYTVRDFGRGIPHGMKRLETGEEKEILEILITKANSGGKFDSSSYTTSAGLNGLGLTITNALSKYIKIISNRKGKFVSIYSEGGSNTKLDRGKTTEPDGTYVEFIPNPEMFKSSVIPDEFIIDRCKISNALGFKSELYIDGNLINTESTMHGLITEELDKLSVYADIPVIDCVSTREVLNDKQETTKISEKLKVALRYTSDTKDRYFGYTNLLNNSLGGTHVKCIADSVVNSWETFLNKHKNLKPVTELRKTDYLVGLRAVVAVFIREPEFSSQTKEKLVVNKHYFDDLMVRFEKELVKFLEDNVVLSQQLLKRFEEYRISQNALLSRKEITSLIKVNTDDGDNIRRRSVVSKLVECTSKKRDNTELFIVEGNSALGPYLYVRDKEHQAVLPLRGKILNITGKSIKEAIQNKEICDIANSIGCGIGASCDAKKSRYERIIISADADEDGKQINCLVLSVFINLFPDLVKNGMVYVSMPPLYCWGDNVKNYGWCNRIEDVPAGVKNLHRFKG